MEIFSTENLVDLHAFYQENGFVCVKSTLTPSYLREMRSIMLELIETEKSTLNVPNYRDYGFLLCAPYYADRYPQILDILKNKELLQFPESLLEKWFILYLYSNNCIPPHGGNTKAYLPHIDTPRVIPGYNYSVVSMVTLDDYTLENGATWVLPHSQFTTERPADDLFYREAARVVVPKGTICYFNPSVWHASGTNHSTDWRCCLLLVFCRPWMKQRVDIPRFMSHIDKSSISEDVKQLLGFRCQPPSDFNEFYGDEQVRTFTQPFV